MKTVNKYLMYGLLADVLLIVTGTFVFLIILIFDYRGMCLDFLAVTMASPCSFYEYLTRDVFLLFLLLLAEYWWLILIVMLLPPVVGYLAGRRR